MLKGLWAFASLFVLLIGVPAQDSYAQTEPKGWICEYRINEGQSDGPTIYNCWGASLEVTRARTKHRCVINALCNAGACLPLDFTPRTACQK